MRVIGAMQVITDGERGRVIVGEGGWRCEEAVETDGSVINKESA